MYVYKTKTYTDHEVTDYMRFMKRVLEQLMNKKKSLTTTFP